MLKAARYYKGLGFSVVATNAYKQSVGEWSAFQMIIPTDRQLEEMFNDHRASGIALVCGKISGNFEGIDVDSKYDLSGKLFRQFIDLIGSHDRNLRDQLVIAETRNKGYHLFYRCPIIGRNTVLAKRSATEQEQRDNPHVKVKALIEIRAEGGIIIVPPTSGYRFIQHDIRKIPTISSAQRNIIFKSAEHFNQVQREINHQKIISRYDDDPNSPYNDYNRRGDFIELLQRHGWIIVKRRGSKTVFRRPGDTTNYSSGDYCSKLGLFTVFTPNTEFDAYKGYRPYQLFAILECGKDYRLAAKKLLEMGYGLSYIKQRELKETTNRSKYNRI